MQALWGQGACLPWALLCSPCPGQCAAWWRLVNGSAHQLCGVGSVLPLNAWVQWDSGRWEMGDSQGHAAYNLQSGLELWIQGPLNPTHKLIWCLSSKWSHGLAASCAWFWCPVVAQPCPHPAALLPAFLLFCWRGSFTWFPKGAAFWLWWIVVSDGLSQCDSICFMSSKIPHQFCSVDYPCLVLKCSCGVFANFNSSLVILWAVGNSIEYKSLNYQLSSLSSLNCVHHCVYVYLFQIFS